MREYWARFLDRPTSGIEVAVATIVIAILGLAQPLAAINIFNNYLSFGLSGTLIAITSGALIAILFEAILRQARLRSLRTMCDTRDKGLFGRLKAPGSISRLSAVRKAFGPKAMSDWLDLPTAFIFVAVLMVIHWSLAAVAATMLVLIYGIGWLAKLNTGELMTDRQASIQAMADTTNDSFDEAFEKVLAQDNRTEGKQSFLEAVQKMLAGFTTVLVLSLGAILTFNGLLTPGELIASNILAMRAYMIVTKWNGGSEARLLGQVSVAQLQQAKKNPVQLVQTQTKENSNA